MDVSSRLAGLFCRGERLSVAAMTETAATPHDQFPTTHWSVVLLAGQKDSPHAREALEALRRTYWYPLSPICLYHVRLA